uniref:Uncharacterized protein n=1 Tax=Anopheles atroparvus TaxID=41427 RepID=A0AAG5D4D3_ANOAO
MVSMMDVESNRQICDNNVILSQSAVSQKSIDLDLSIKSPTSPTSARETSLDQQCTSSVSSPPSVSSVTSFTATVITVPPAGSIANTTKNNVTDTELAKKAMKLDLVDATSSGSLRGNRNPVGSISTASSSASVNASATSTTQSSTSISAVTTTTAIIMKHHHHKLKERTFSDEIGSPKSPASTTGMGVDRSALMFTRQNSLTIPVEVVDDRKALRDALYQGIFHRHRRTIFAVGSFLRMLKSKNSSYNTIRSSSEGEDDTR